MTKVRRPGSWEAATVRAMGLLSAEYCAELGEVTPSAVRKWADPDCHTLPNLRQALAIDKACKREFGETPYAMLMQEQLQAEAFEHHPCLMTTALDATVVVGRLAEEVRSAKAPTGPGGHRITPRERQTIAGVAENMKRTAQTILDQCDFHLEADDGLKVVG